MATYNAAKHDLGLLMQDGTTTVGLMLARDRDGMPMYRVRDDEYLAEQQTQVPGYDSLEPEKEMRIGQEDWCAGVGQLIYESSDSKRYLSSAKMDLRFKGRALLGPLPIAITKPEGVVRAWAEFNGKLCIAVVSELGSKLCELDTDLDEFVNISGETFTGKYITDLEPFNGNLIIALGGGNNYYYMSADETPVFTPTTNANCKADFFQAIDTTLWKACKPNEMKSSLDPTDEEAWTGAYPVGFASDNITGLLEESGSLYVMKEDMPYYWDNTGAAFLRLIPELKTMQSATSGENSHVWQGKLYIPCGAQGLVEYTCDDGAINWRSPSKFTDVIDFIGRVEAVTSDEEWLFILTNNVTQARLLAGRLEVIDGSIRWVWHPISYTSYEAVAGCQIAFTSSVYRRRLYVACTDGAKELYYFTLPQNYGDITDDAYYQFVTTGVLITPWLHGDFKGDSKLWIKLTLTMEAVNEDRYFQVRYQLLGGQYVLLGTFKTDPMTTRYITTVTNNVIANKVSNWIRFEILGTTNDPTKTPILKGYDLRAILHPQRRQIINCVVRCSDSITLKPGQGKETGQASTIATALSEATNTTGLITIWDINGNANTVKFQPMSEEIVRDEKDEAIERHFILTLQKVPLS